MHIRKYLDYPKLVRHIENGLVDCRKHQQFPLAILTYSRKTIFDNLWDDVTEKCRGLIVNTDTWEIVARPFEKFFNLNTDFRPETQTINLPKSNPIIMEKLDGSLGIGYEYNGKWFIASKGSFHSDHANWANAWYSKYCKYAIWPIGYTPVFEMVCQNVQHHVVHYNGDALYLIALVNKETGEELSYNELYHWSYVNGPHILLPQVYSACKVNDTNAEGYVLSWPRQGETPFKVKVKFPDFLRKQKIMHGTGPKLILELLEQGTSLAPYMQDTTPQFEKFVLDWKYKIEHEFHKVLSEAANIYNNALINLRNAPRKDYAMYFLQPDYKPYSGILFAMLDENVEEIKRSVWKLVKPIIKDAKPFVLEED